MLNWLREMVAEFLSDDCPGQAAAVAYFAVTSFFPGLLLGIAVLNYWVGDQARGQVLELMRTYIPIPSIQQYVVENFDATLLLGGPMGAFGLVVLLWASKGIFLALESGLSRCWKQKVRHKTWRRYARAMLLVAVIGLVITAQFAATAASQALLAYRVPLWGFSLSQWGLFSRLLSWIISPIMLFLVLTALYKVMPPRDVPWRTVAPGALFAAVLWKVAEHGFLIYSTYAARASALFGALSIILALLVWCYLSANIFFLGAEFIFVSLRRRGLTE